MTHSSRKLSPALRISIDDVRIGMFIAELDRPWTNSPFLLQGFLLSEELDLKTLQSLVQEVVIDPSRSDIQSLSNLPWDLLHQDPVEVPDSPNGSKAAPTTVSKITYVGATPQQVGTQALEKISLLSLRSLLSRLKNVFTAPHHHPAQPYYLRHQQGDDAHDDSKADRSTRLAPPSEAEFSAFIKTTYPKDVLFLPLSWKERWRQWRAERRRQRRHRDYPRGKNVRRRSHKNARPDFIPDNIKLVAYADFIPIEEEITFARNITERTNAILLKLESDIQDDRSIALEEIGPAVNLLTASVISNPAALMWLIRIRSENSAAYAHCLKVAIYMMALGRHIGFPRQQLNELGYIGLLLDVGKLELPTSLLQKPEKLSDDEYDLMRSHVSSSINILRASDSLAENVLRGIAEHHERLDGSGYPNGLRGNQISIFGKIAAIADSFAAMTSPRAYDITRSPFDAMKELFKEAGSLLHAPLVEEFVQAIGIFPLGSMIELSTGEVAIVLEHNKVRRLEPKVLILTNADKAMLDTPNVVDLMRQKNSASKDSRKIVRGLPDGAYDLACQDYYQH